MKKYLSTNACTPVARTFSVFDEMHKVAAASGYHAKLTVLRTVDIPTEWWVEASLWTTDNKCVYDAGHSDVDFERACEGCTRYMLNFLKGAELVGGAA